MKLIFKIAAGVLLAAIVVFAIAEIKIRSAEAAHKSSARENTTAEAKGRTDEFVRATDERILNMQAQRMAMEYAPSEGTLYKLCHAFPPTTEKHKLECSDNQKKFNKMEAKTKSNRW